MTLSWDTALEERLEAERLRTRRRLKRKRTAARILALILAGAGVLGVVLQLRKPSLPTGLLDPQNWPNYAKQERRAVSLVIGETRDDGMLFGEWVKQRRIRECAPEKLDPRKFSFEAAPGCCFPPKYFTMWHVVFVYEGVRYGGCEIGARLATVYSHTAFVEPIDSRLGSTSVEFGKDGKPRSGPASESVWLNEFRRGDPP